MKKFIKWNIKKSPGSEQKLIIEKLKKCINSKPSLLKYIRGLYITDNADRETRKDRRMSSYYRVDDRTCLVYQNTISEIFTTNLGVLWRVIKYNNLRQELLVRQGYNSLILLL